MKRLMILVMLIALLAFPRTSQAKNEQIDKKSLVILEEIVVTAGRIVEEKEDVTINITVVTEEEIPTPWASHSARQVCAKESQHHANDKHTDRGHLAVRHHGDDDGRHRGSDERKEGSQLRPSNARHLTPKFILRLRRILFRQGG